MLFCFAIEGFLGWVFFWVWFNVHTFNRSHRADRRVKGWLRRNGCMGGCEVWVYRWAEGEGKGGVWVGFINTNDMYITMSVRG